jgi:cyclohexanone monooxygenase
VPGIGDVVPRTLIAELPELGRVGSGSQHAGRRHTLPDGLDDQEPSGATGRARGARCDVESMQYSYQFSEELQQEWVWSERYAPQPEILRYANHVADRFNLRRDIQFDTRVHSAHFDDGEGRWVLEVGDGEQLAATYCVMATDCLSSANMPKFAGIDSFRGETYHTGHWPHESVDLSDKRVGVIGTGSSAIQSIPIIARQAAHLYVFQRTANYTIPAHNGPLDPAYQQR